MGKVKTNTRYYCTDCGSVSPGWLGRCPSCGKFGTIVEEIEEVSAKEVKKPSALSRPVRLSEVSEEKLVRISSGIAEFDEVLGGGIVPASLVLIGGDPGIGKSTLMTQVACNLAKNYKVLYASAEESPAQVKMRAKRLSLSGADMLLLGETELNAIIDAAADADFLIVDSIQATYLSEMNSSAGSVGQVKECAARLMRFAKAEKKTVFIIGHVTKEGAIAGPKVLEHIMDAVLYFEGQTQDNCKLLRAVKNRFGSAQEVGVFEMTDKGIFGVKDYSGLFLSDGRGENAGSVVTPSISGNRAIAVEIQSLVSKTAFGLPRRMPLGIDYNRAALIIAILEKRAYIPFYSSDVYVTAMGGIKLTEPAADLAVAIALASSAFSKAVPKDLCAFGEIGLTGEVRGVNFTEKRLSECYKLGFKTAIIPASNKSAAEKFAGKMKIIPVKHIYQTVKILFDGETVSNE